MLRDAHRDRRDFLAASVAGAVAGLATGGFAADEDSSGDNGIPLRALGNTGQQVSCLCMGGFHIGTVQEEKEAVRILHAAVDEGVTFWDNAWDYHQGRSEEIMGQALVGRRDKVFLMTKNCGRDRKTSQQHLDDSLRRLNTDHLDLWQFHEINYDNDPDWIFQRGAIDVAVKAREQGKVRFIGFTGHKDPRIHLKMLDQDFAWDTVQMPLNVMDAHFRSFQQRVLPVLLERGIGPVAMKSLAGGAIPDEARIPVSDAMRYTLSLPVSTLVSGIRSMEELKENASTARRGPLPPEAIQQVLARAKPVAGDGRYERFKTTQQFDGSYHRRQHGFG